MPNLHCIWLYWCMGQDGGGNFVAPTGAAVLVIAIVSGVLTLAYALGAGSGGSDVAKAGINQGDGPQVGGGPPNPPSRPPGAGPSNDAVPDGQSAQESGTALLAPDLRVQVLYDLAFDFAYVEGEPRRVIRFGTTITNTGLGPLELHSLYDEERERTVVMQRIYGPGGEHDDVRVGDFVFHPGHAHWHMDEFVSYRLYAFDNDEQNGRELATTKTSFCITDDHRQLELHAAPVEAVYGGCDNVVQGISVGWNDIYTSDLIDQWIDLGPDDGSQFLPDGDYAIVADVSPQRLISETDTDNNFSVTYFSVQDDEIITG